MFIIPHYSNNNASTKVFLYKAINSIFNQTDTNWKIVIVDDMSPDKDAVANLYKLKNKAPDRIHIIEKPFNSGPGDSRNIGIKWAYRNKAPIILFLDADDIAHHRRLEIVRKIMIKDTLASVVYSTFKVIDENDELVPFERLTGSIQEIIEGHNNPIQGFNAWVDIGIDKGYTNLTSTTNVRTEIANKYPFPSERVSEDSYTWLLYSSGGGKFIYNREIQTLYRVKTIYNDIVSSTISLLGREKFYRDKCRVDSCGFLKAIEIAINNGKIKTIDKDELMIRFYLRLARTMSRENCLELSIEQIVKAKKINYALFNKFSKLSNL